MPGSVSDPVKLDPFQTIIEVGWNNNDPAPATLTRSFSLMFSQKYTGHAGDPASLKLFLVGSVYTHKYITSVSAIASFEFEASFYDADETSVAADQFSIFGLLAISPTDVQAYATGFSVESSFAGLIVTTTHKYWPITGAFEDKKTHSEKFVLLSLASQDPVGTTSIDLTGYSFTYRGETYVAFAIVEMPGPGGGTVLFNKV